MPPRTRRPGNSPAPRPARAGARRAGSTVSSTERCRNAAAAATPPRACARPAERSSSAAASSSGPGVARARCQARRSGSVSTTVASARARCTRAGCPRLPSDRRRTGPAGGEPTARPARAARRLAPEPRPRCRSRASRGPAEQDRVAEGLGGSGQDEQLRVGREQVEAPDVALFDPPGDRLAAGKTEPAGETGDVPGAWQLEQGERVAVTLLDDLVADGGV